MLQVCAQTLPHTHIGGTRTKRGHEARALTLVPLSYFPLARTRTCNSRSFGTGCSKIAPYRLLKDDLLAR
ncbi:hypothetical protein AOLI_G00045950 [Acnodon oligacanthus]